MQHVHDVWATNSVPYDEGRYMAMLRSSLVTESLNRLTKEFVDGLADLIPQEFPQH